MAGKVEEEHRTQSRAREMIHDLLADREVRTTRRVTIPQEVAFAAWTDPGSLMRWWGPSGYTNTFHRFDLQPGGIWEYTMHGADGAAYNNTCVFKRIEPCAYLEFDHLKEMHFYTALVRFMVGADGTVIEWTMRFDTAEELAPIRRFIQQANEENMDRLEALLLNP